jgi:hypothetical protein
MLRYGIKETIMKNYILLGVFALILTGCAGLNKQVSQIKALEDCKFEISSTDSISVANIDIKEFMGEEKVDLRKMPRLAFALLRKNVPLKARLNLVINNPSNQLAAINQFEYKVLVKNKELANGFVNRKISVSPNGGSTTVPIQINSNIYEVIADDKTMDAVSDFIIGDEKTERKGMITIKIKPTLDWGNKQIQYPGFISIDKEISSKLLF